MNSIQSPCPKVHPPQTPRGGRTTDALIERIRQALDDDGSFVEPGSVDSQGLIVIAGVYRIRVELSEPELLDWEEHSPSGPLYPNYTRAAQAELDRERAAQESIDRNWMADTGDDIPF